MWNGYQVVDTNTKDVVDTGFENRSDAKKARDERNGGPPKENVMPQFVVSRGEGHPHGASFGPVEQEKRWIK